MKSWFNGMVLCLMACMAQAQTANPPPRGEMVAAHPLLDQVWDVRAGRFISLDSLYQRAAAARYVLLGETHDSSAHHERQLWMLQALAARGVVPTLAMEQFDTEHQAELAQAQQAGETDAELLADAGQLNRTGWRWPLYKDLIAWAAQQQWPLRAANLSRAEGRQIALGTERPTLPAIDPEVLAQLENDVIQGHCGYRPAPEQLGALVNAQRARDLRMAQSLDAGSGPVVLVAGLGHVRTDRAVPLYLAQPQQALAIGLLEVRPDQKLATDYPATGLDVLWFTPAQERSNPCDQPFRFPSSSPKKANP